MRTLAHAVPSDTVEAFRSIAWSLSILGRPRPISPQLRPASRSHPPQVRRASNASSRAPPGVSRQSSRGVKVQPADPHLPRDRRAHRPHQGTDGRAAEGARPQLPAVMMPRGARSDPLTVSNRPPSGAPTPRRADNAQNSGVGRGKPIHSSPAARHDHGMAGWLEAPVIGAMGPFRTASLQIARSRNRSSEGAERCVQLLVARRHQTSTVTNKYRSRSVTRQPGFEQQITSNIYPPCPSLY
jgi:hypothetical protein